MALVHLFPNIGLDSQKLQRKDVYKKKEKQKEKMNDSFQTVSRLRLLTFAC